LTIDRAAPLLPPTSPLAPASAIAALRAATWPSHQRLEKRIDVKSRFGTLPAYCAHLSNLHGFCVCLESRVGLDTFGAALPDYPSRRKRALLEADLVALGLDMAMVTALPVCTSLPAASTRAAAFGMVYVFEGATLGGRALLPVVQTRLGLTANHGATFLASYGATVGAMWARFGAALDAWCQDASRRDAAEAAAIATFDALEHWLCREPA
jgi:heme oxygenase